MKKKFMGVLLAAVLAAAALPAVPAYADGQKVVTLGADLSEEQKNAVLRYFGILGQNVPTLIITNQDERNHLASYVPIEQIGTRTFSCALVNPTSSGGIQVKTANLTWVTGNMIATTLSTSGVVNCEVLAASPFEVSGTGALTGIIMAYETASGTRLDPVKKDLATEELVTTGTIANTVGQQEATSIVNEIKIQIIENQVEEPHKVEEIVDNVIEESSVSALSEGDKAMLNDLANKIAQQQYDYEQMKETLERVEQNVSNVNVNVNVTNNNTQENSQVNNNTQTQEVSNDSSSTSSAENTNEDSIFNQGGDASVIGAESTATSTIEGDIDTSADASSDNSAQTDIDDGFNWNETTTVVDPNAGQVQDQPVDIYTEPEQSIFNENQDIFVEQPADQQIMTEAPAVEEPVYQEEQPAAEEPVYQEEQPYQEEPVYQEEQPYQEEPVYQEEQPAVEEQVPEAEPEVLTLALTEDMIRIMPAATDDFGAPVNSNGVNVIRIDVAGLHVTPAGGSVSVTDMYGDTMTSIDLTDSSKVFVRDLNGQEIMAAGFDGSVSEGTQILVLVGDALVNESSEAGDYTVRIDGFTASDASGANNMDSPLSMTAAIKTEAVGITFDADSIDSFYVGRSLSGYAVLDGMNYVSASVSSPDGSVSFDNTELTPDSNGFTATLQTPGTATININFLSADGVTVVPYTYVIPVIG